ncbi:hypothetical protein F4824DRAFT_423058 [Ustulina deusta]|nr:hypothetical protein F4824DRAFT_423058 [Ustulina deusta]
MEYVSEHDVLTDLDVTSKRHILISPDGSRFAISNGLTTVLVRQGSGWEIQRYDKPQTIGRELHPIAFSSDGQTLALSMEATIYIARTTEPGLQLWYEMQETDLRRVAISEDFKAAVDIVGKRVVLTSLATGRWAELESTSALSEAEASKLQFWFAKHDKLLVCSDMRQLYFFSTGNGRLLKTEPIYDSTNLANPPLSTCVLSGDTFLLGVVVQDKVGRKSTVCASFFQLSGRLPELVSTFRNTAMLDLESPLISLSFNGCYFAQCDRMCREISIFHVMSGKKVFRQRVDGVCRALSFFPSDNRLVWLTPTSYHIERMIIRARQEPLTWALKVKKMAGIT